MIKVVQNLVDKAKYNIKCPYSMTPTRIVVHNTANDASAANEIAYMIRNDNEVSFHFAVDDKEVVQGIPLDRNAWHAGDGANGTGNRYGIAIEICYSKSGGPRFINSEKLAAKFIAQQLQKRGWGIDKVTKHQDYSDKYCPHRTLDMGWQRFLNMIKEELGEKTTSSTDKKSVDTIVDEVIAGKWGNGTDRKNRLEAAGYDYDTIQNKVNAKLNGGSSTSSTPSKSVSQIAKEVIAGKWGNGSERKKKLEAAGYDYDAVQAEVNKQLGVSTKKQVTSKVVQDVIDGKYGNGTARKKALEAAGYDYNEVQAAVNKKLA